MPIYPTRLLARMAGIVIVVLLCGAAMCSTAAHAGGDQCGHLTAGTDVWRDCRHDALVSDFESLTMYARGLETTVMQHRAALVVAKGRIEELERQVFTTVQTSMGPARQSTINILQGEVGQLEARVWELEAQVETNRIATLDQSVDIWDLEANANALNTTVARMRTPSSSIAASDASTLASGYELHVDPGTDLWSLQDKIETNRISVLDQSVDTFDLDVRITRVENDIPCLVHGNVVNEQWCIERGIESSVNELENDLHGIEGTDWVGVMGVQEMILGQITSDYGYHLGASWGGMSLFDRVAELEGAMCAEFQNVQFETCATP